MILFRAFIALFFSVGIACAQVPMTGAGLGTPAVISGYTGPIDVVAAPSAIYLLRAASGAIAAAGTQKVINLRNTSSNETCDVIVATSGKLGVTANCSISSNGVTPTVFCTVGGCAVSDWYDQSGHSCDVSQATAGSQPIFTVTGGPFTGLLVNSITFNGSSQVLNNTTCTPPSLASGGVTLYAWVQTTNGQSDTCVIKTSASGSTNGQYGMVYGSTTVLSFLLGSVAFYDSVITFSANFWYLQAESISGNSGIVTYISQKAGAGQNTGTNSIGNETILNPGYSVGEGNSAFWGGPIEEAGVWPNTVTAANMTSIYGQQ